MEVERERGWALSIWRDSAPGFCITTPGKGGTHLEGRTGEGDAMEHVLVGA